MDNYIENLKKRIQKIKKERPPYKEILNFYMKLRTEQEKIKPQLNLQPVQLRREWKEFLSKEGFPLFEKKEIPIDTESAILLFKNLCKIAKNKNPFMSTEVEKIDNAIKEDRLILQQLFLDFLKEEKIDRVLNEIGIDKKIITFLLKESIRPSIQESIKKLINEVDRETWSKNICPICGSLPFISILKEEVGKRYLICPYCECRWRYDRIACPFCENRQQESLQYFYAEQQEEYRINTCEKCKQYIKTLDQREKEFIDPVLEDISTLHLDILATRKGYKRPTPNFWMYEK